MDITCVVKEIEGNKIFLNFQNFLYGLEQSPSRWNKNKYDFVVKSMVLNNICILVPPPKICNGWIVHKHLSIR